MGSVIRDHLNLSDGAPLPVGDARVRAPERRRSREDAHERLYL